jgi:hypothetical protein
MVGPLPQSPSSATSCRHCVGRSAEHGTATAWCSRLSREPGGCPAPSVPRPRRTVRAAPVPRIRLHDLRHTHAPLLLRAGINPKVISERLGRSSVAFALDTYAHVMQGMQPEAAEKLADLVWGDDGQREERGA